MSDADSAEYEPSSWDWVAEQVAEYEASGGTRANTLMDTGIPIVVITMKGHKSGKIRKVPLMRVEHEGEYALIGSKGGMPEHPHWVHNLDADPNVSIQDGAEPRAFVAREVTGAVRDEWYERGTAVYPPYADYAVSAAAADRVIRVWVASPT
ncbi:MAG: nitroreductase/quinone reductase family protein [Acidimicrobiales bacterium]